MGVEPVTIIRNRFGEPTFLSVLGVMLAFLSTGYSWVRGSVEGVYAIKAGRIVTVTQGVVEPGTMVIRDGIIEMVGKDVVIPPDAEVVETDTMVVYPGLIDAHTSLALVQPKQEEQKTSDESEVKKKPPQPLPTLLGPEKLSVDLLNPKGSKIAKVRETGVTTVLTVPDEGVFIGQSALINLCGEKAEEMILKSPVALHLGYSPQKKVYPSTLMGVIAFQRQTFLDARHHKLLWDRYRREKRGWKRPLPNRSLDALIPVLEGRMPVIISANKENEIKRAFRLADEFGLNMILSGAVEGWRVVDLLESRQKPVLVSVNYPKPEAVTGYAFKLKVEGPSEEKSKKKEDKPEKKDKEKEKEEKEDDPEKAEVYANAGALYRAGIRFAFTSRGLKKPSDLVKNVGKAVEHGLPEEEALKALTLYPAEVLGVADQIGSIEEGKIANLVLTTGDLFDEKTSVKMVFVDGKKFEIEKPKKEEDEEESGKDDSDPGDGVR